MQTWQWLLLPLCVLLGALGYRIRGGLLAGTRFQTPGQVSRLVFALTAGVSALAGGAVWWHAAVLVPCFWAACTFPLLGAIDLGKNEGTFWGDFALLTARGLLAVVFAVPALWWFGYAWPVLAVAGALMAPAYWSGRQLRVEVEGLGKGHDAPETGEAIFGAILAAGSFLAVAL